MNTLYSDDDKTDEDDENSSKDTAAAALLGEGTYGKVYKGVLSNDQACAVKEVRLLYDKEFNEKKRHAFQPDSAHKLISFILAEIYVLKNLKHPNVIQFFGWKFSPQQLPIDQLCCINDVNDDDDDDKDEDTYEDFWNARIYLYFELMSCNLDDYIDEKGYKNINAKSIFTQICLGLEHVHSRGFFHRDLSCGNILVSKDTVKIADFGFANKYVPNKANDLYVTNLWYRAPEIFIGNSYYSQAVDIWALGCILHRLYTGLPFIQIEWDSTISALFAIFQKLGTPTKNSWLDFHSSYQIDPKIFPNWPLNSYCLVKDNQAVNDVLINHLLVCNPNKRDSIQSVLRRLTLF